MMEHMRLAAPLFRTATARESVRLIMRHPLARTYRAAPPITLLSRDHVGDRTGVRVHPNYERHGYEPTFSEERSL